jgi:hypothetical protein
LHRPGFIIILIANYNIKIDKSFPLWLSLI